MGFMEKFSSDIPDGNRPSWNKLLGLNGDDRIPASKGQRASLDYQKQSEGSCKIQQACMVKNKQTKPPNNNNKTVNLEISLVVVNW